ncbi:MAG: hypothetical protein UR85_C0003G0047 [Candidatus Nomurabacteria bacterium GW2011_GWF2_35_66]|uniref:Uncharacterized protein n=1 Tax=Candidatus Nomurabacteria bacterium GW2011_GWE1_35_16 TaxID=1618761 RepID=A0A0G0BSF5_9BACT|nr:MAG: hypothetical protein UR55_C0005G0046 [Candidatus Nomurabacteria bacterium GW2011_GWF1_34_20]KKP63374.1 MAG: hypothetical protein UR57_C0005G0046 [Candidatus Nomurabacteria bacterium GW2011_GWE2_34_25]KKP66566.1 MAG: hypothetical protein UR64_C0005G0028 [Candidatus Nomurabacteria bacterium GW2011_GWE1_35_16]KKP83612.1 MAG: hypothetical protein UR85_C0003G0047 [Candidatus Nomurabacteria bacterium GW2011_GWF2_35_66]HAE36872.1 hypothetical protein [Candidatus Nomurabacteria bacterium]
MKFVRILLTIVFGVIYWPVNLLHTKVQKWYFAEKKRDIVVWYLFTPIYWIIVAITFIISVPYEFVIARDLH